MLPDLYTPMLLSSTPSGVEENIPYNRLVTVIYHPPHWKAGHSHKKSLSFEHDKYQKYQYYQGKKWCNLPGPNTYTLWQDLSILATV